MGKEVNNKRGVKGLKKAVLKIIFFFLGRGLQAASKLDEVVKEEIKPLNDGFTFSIKVWPLGPSMVMEKRGDRLYYKGSKEPDNVDIEILFKSVEGALLLVLGQIGVAEGYAQHRFMLKGDIMMSMPLIRVLYIVEAYLFPRFMTKKILKKMPNRRSNSFRIYIGLIFGI